MRTGSSGSTQVTNGGTVGGVEDGSDACARWLEKLRRSKHDPKRCLVIEDAAFRQEDRKATVGFATALFGTRRRRDTSPTARSAHLPPGMLPPLP
jgi:hypothetical protein